MFKNISNYLLYRKDYDGSEVIVKKGTSDAEVEFLNKLDSIAIGNDVLNILINQDDDAITMACFKLMSRLSIFIDSNKDASMIAILYRLLLIQFSYDRASTIIEELFSPTKGFVLISACRSYISHVSDVKTLFMVRLTKYNYKPSLYELDELVKEYNIKSAEYDFVNRPEGLSSMMSLWTKRRCEEISRINHL